MPFYKPVNPGDTVTHSAGRENAISQALGQLHAISAPRTARPAGVTSQPVDEYNGYFKVISASNDEGLAIRVIDGSNPQNSYCGHTDLGDYPATTLNYTLPASGMLYVYLTAKFNETSWKYELGFLIAQEPPESPTGYWLLANINPLNVKISQVWTGGAIYWGDRYYI